MTTRDHSSTFTACDVALLTPAGLGAVATIGVRGRDAAQMVATFFHPAAGKRLERFPLGRLVFGRWRDCVAGEEMVACRSAAECVELHCHGGFAACADLMRQLVSAGCREVSWQEWLRTSAENLIAAEARLALAAARTRRVAAILLDQLNGALQRKLEQIAETLRRGDAEQARAALVALDCRCRFGEHLVHPWRVVIAGPVNVGKSSLVNAILGYSRAIVSDSPGTTRDVLTASTATDGWPVELMDTAGLRETDEEVESAGVSLARSRLASADLVVLVSDASRSGGGEPEWHQPGSALPPLLVANKIDLVRTSRPADLPGRAVAVSALTGEGIESLVRALATSLVPNPPEPGEAIPFMERHFAAIRAAVLAVDRGSIEQASQILIALRQASAR